VGIDAAQSAKTLAELGVIGATGGGIAAIGRALMAPSGESSAAPCQVAMSGKVARETPPSTSRKAPAPGQDLPVPKDLGKAIGKLFGR